MDLSFTEEQQILRAAARDFMARECPKETLLEFDESDFGVSVDVWEKAAAIGWLGMLVGEEYGGAGSSFTDAGVVFEQLGAGPLPGPFFSSGVLGALIVGEAGTAEQKRRWLPNIASGREIAALALTEPAYGWDAGSVRMSAEPTDSGYALNGVKLFVHDARAATTLICPVRTTGQDGVTLLMVDARADGLSTRALSGFMGWVGEVEFEDVEVGADAVLGEPGDGWRPLERAFLKAIPALCAYKVGAAQATLDMTLEYSRERVQFGVPIGRFQRVQDHIVEMVNHLDAARWTAYEALWKLDSGRADAASVHLAKAVASEAYYQGCNHAHEVHAGIGVVREYGLTLHTRMSRALYHLLGDPRHHRRRLGETLALG